MFKKTVLLCLLILTALGMIVVGCGGETPKSNSAKKPKLSHVITVGTSASFAPFEYKNANGKDYMGFDVDLMTAIAKEMDSRIEIHDMKFDQLLSELDAGKVDVVISGMTDNDERRQQADFSASYYKTGLTIVVKNTDTVIKDLDDLAGKKVAVQRGTSSSDVVSKLPDVTLKEMISASDALQELAKGRVDAVVNDRPVNDYYIVKNGYADLKVLEELIFPEDYAIAVSKKNPELLRKIDAILLKLKKNGTYDKIYKKWFTRK